jgi:hypothetical protein
LVKETRRGDRGEEGDEKDHDKRMSDRLADHRRRRTTAKNCFQNQPASPGSRIVDARRRPTAQGRLVVALASRRVATGAARRFLAAAAL